MKPRAYEVRITNQAKKDIDKLAPKLKAKLRDILNEVIAKTPYEGKKLIGDLAGNYSYRLSFKDRLVYSIDDIEGIVYLKRARTHYGE
ncbi:MAG: type II toxin-antitoxin system RelE/ParE family toxin [Candidatus Omnitrophica bacterium]|nr:type II toxin-antitoxin system RelE/ParE family toxin [Candidatus Omnitrophota bacterium]